MRQPKTQLLKKAKGKASPMGKGMLNPVAKTGAITYPKQGIQKGMK